MRMVGFCQGFSEDNIDSKLFWKKYIFPIDNIYIRCYLYSKDYKEKEGKQWRL